MDWNVFVEVWNFLSRSREDVTQDAETVQSATVKVLRLLRTSTEFPNRLELYFKNSMRIAQRFREEPAQLLAYFHDIDLFSNSISSLINKNASLAKANSYFRCLLTYTHAAARDGNVQAAEKSLAIHTATFKAVSESQLSGTLLDIEESSLNASKLLYHWQIWTTKPSDSVCSNRLSTSLQQVLTCLNRLTSVKTSLNLVDKSNCTDEYQAMSKLLAQLKEWADIVMRLKSLSGKLSPDTKQKLRELLKEYASLYEKSANEESALPANIQTFRQPQCVSVALGCIALLSVDLGDMDSALVYFEKAESTIRASSTFPALRQLYQQLHLAVGYIAESPSRLPYATSWMKQSCQLHQEYNTLFPREKSNELATKLGFLASLESRSVPIASSTTAPSNRLAKTEATKENKTRAAPSSQPQSSCSGAANSAQALQMALQTNWLPTDLFPLVELHIKRQLQGATSATSNDALQLFFDLYASRISSDRISDFFKLVDLESTHYLYHGKIDTQQRLINSALGSGHFASSVESARLLIIRVIGARRRKPPTDNSSIALPSTSDIAKDLTEALSILEGIVGEEPTPTNSKVMSEMALVQCLRSIGALETPSSSTFFDARFDSLERLLDITIQLYNTVLSRMLAVKVGADSSSVSKPLLDQNRSHWHSLDVPFEHLMLLRDLLQFYGDQRRFIAVSKILIKFLATLVPFGPEHGEHARIFLYSQIGASFHELGYDDPLATKYFSKSGSTDEREVVDRLLQTDASLNAEIGVWLSNSILFLHDLGKLPEFDYIGHLETVSESLDSEASETSQPSRFKFLQQVRATVQYTLAHLKATSGRIDEAIIDALIAFRLRAPSAPKLPSSSANSSNTAASTPPYWKSSSWRFSKQFIDSMDQLGHLYSMQGSASEARYYYSMALHLAQKHTNESSQFHFMVQLAQLDIDSCAKEASQLETVVPVPSTSHSVSLASASALTVKGNLCLRSGNYEDALQSYHEAEQLLLALIDATYVHQLDHLEDIQSEESSSTKPKATSRGRGPKKTSAAASSAATSTLYRFSLSPAKLPKVRVGLLPSDYTGLKSTQLRILAKIASVDYLRHSASDSPDALLSAASTKLANVRKQLEELDQCPSVRLDLAITMLNQAQVMIAETGLENGKSAWDAPTSSRTSTATGATAKPKAARSAAKPKQVVDKLLMARETLSTALALSVSAGSIPKVSSDICRYFVEVSGLVDPWLTAAKQNCSIGITMRHQMLENIYRLGIRKKDPEDSEEGSEVKQLEDEMDSKLTLSEGDGKAEEEYEAMLSSQIGELDFVDDQVDGETFKRMFVDILSTNEETKNYTICTVSMGPNGRSLVVSRLRHGDEPLLARISLESALDEHTAGTFSRSADTTESEEDEACTPALVRSATALLAPLLNSSTATKQPSLKRSASSTTSIQSMSAQSAATTEKRGLAKSTSSTQKAASTTSAAAKKSSSKSTAKTLMSIDEIGPQELNDMLSSLSLGGVDTSSSSPSPATGAVENIFQRFHREFNMIIEDSKSIAITSEAKSEETSKDFTHRWWSQRYALDDRMSSWLSNFEDSILSPYKTLFLGKLTDAKLESSLINSLEDLRSQVERSLAVPNGTINSEYFKALVLGSDASSLRDVMESLSVLVCWQGKTSPSTTQALKKASLLIKDTMMSASSIASNALHRHEQTQTTSALLQHFNGSNLSSDEAGNECRADKTTLQRQSRHPVILILDKHLHALPWESIPSLRPNPTTRLPSIFSLRSSIMSYLQSDSIPNVLRDGLDARKLFYILNPSQDLKSSQETLQPLLQEKDSQWSGIVGEKPTTADYSKALEQYNLLLYAGHNSGVQYLNGEASELRKVRTRAGGCAVWMMGCSSAKLKDQNDFDPSGMALTFMLGGSPSVVGNLWDVTTRDLDKATVSMINWLKTTEGNTSLPEAVLRARRECKLEFINAAALITYGLPLRVKCDSTLKGCNKNSQIVVAEASEAPTTVSSTSSRTGRSRRVK